MDEMMQSEPMEAQGIDGVIARVEEYIQNPQMVTPETLMALKDELMDLKTVLDGEMAPEESQPTAISEMMAKHGGVE